MAECILYNGGMFNNDYLTAKPEDVKYGQTFIGAGTENTQEGTMPTYYNVEHDFPINGKFSIPEGYFVSITLKQDIPTLGAQYVDPSINGTTAGVKGTYMTGNVFIGGISGLSSAVIKKGVKIGPYIGTFEGWVD